MKEPLQTITPTFYHHELSKKLNKNIYLKMECYQPVGSFKIRGLGNFCKHLPEGTTHLVGASGGNAGLAIAFIASYLGLDATIFVYETISAAAQNKITNLGAKTIKVTPNLQHLLDTAQSMAVKPGHVFVHPFDDPLIWQGHATMIDEVIQQQNICPEVVVASVGGGGLMCGVIEGLKRNGLHNIPTIAVETKGADSLAASIKANKIVDLDQITSIATTLGANRIAEQLWKYYQTGDMRSVVVSDRDAIQACLRFVDDFRVLVEPASGASLSLLYNNHKILEEFNDILIVVCGGAGVDMEQFLKFAHKFSD